MTKHEILRILDDDDIQKSLQKIMSGSTGFSSNQDSKLFSSKSKMLAEQLAEKESLISSLQNSNNMLESKVNSLNSTVNSLENDKSTLISNTQKLEGEKTQLNSSVQKLEVEKTTLVSNIQTLNGEKTSLNSNVQKLESEIVTKNKNIASLENEISIFLKYNNLDFSIKSEFANTIGNPTSFAQFIAFGLDKQVIDNTYDFIAHGVLNGNLCENTTQLAILQEILIYFIELSNTKFKQNLFKIDTVKIGDEFNPTKHSKHKESKQSGSIDAVYLMGYTFTNPKTNNITEKKSIVMIK